MRIELDYYELRVENKQPIYNLVHLGYIDVDSIDPEAIFAICNWSLWSNKKPDSLHADIKECSHGLRLSNPETGGVWLAKSVGWINGQMKDIDAYVDANKHRLIWM